MDIPEPDDVPSQKLRAYLSNLVEAIRGIRPVNGAGIAISEFPGKGTVISTAASAATATGLTVTDGTTTVSNVTTLSFDGTLFTVTDGGGGIAEITLQTESCS